MTGASSPLRNLQQPMFVEDVPLLGHRATASMLPHFTLRNSHEGRLVTFLEPHGV